MTTFYRHVLYNPQVRPVMQNSKHGYSHCGQFSKTTVDVKRDKALLPAKLLCVMVTKHQHFTVIFPFPPTISHDFDKTPNRKLVFFLFFSCHDQNITTAATYFHAILLSSHSQEGTAFPPFIRGTF